MAIDSAIESFAGIVHNALPTNGFLAFIALFALAFTAIVAVNVAKQLLLPRDPSLPPLVFHFVPVIGSAVVYGIDPYKFLFDCRKKHGDVFTFVMLGREMTVALGPAGNNLILNGKLAQVSAEDAYTHLTTPVFGEGVVYDCPNHMLMEQKKMMKSGLNRENLERYVHIIVKETREFLLRNLDDESHITHWDTFKRTSELTMCTASATLQGKEVRKGLDGVEFARLYHDLDGGFTPINFVFPNLPLPSYKRRDVAHIKMRHFYLDIMKARRDAGVDFEPDMLFSLQNQVYKDGTPVTDRDVAHMMIALLMAGQHTSATTLAWLLFHVASREDIQQALLDEQESVHGRNKDGKLNPLNYDKLLSPLLVAVIKETLRLHPPLHSLIRKVKAPITVPPTLGTPSASKDSTDTYVIPPGHYVLAAPGVSHIDSANWRDPLDFDPYRWIRGEVVEDKEDKDEDKIDYGFGAISTGANSAYLPFGSGRHRCIGEQFATLQLCTILATLVRDVEMRVIGAFPGPDYTTMIVTPKGGKIALRVRHNPVVASYTLDNPKVEED